MADFSLALVIADYQELHITLRDDLARFGNVTSGEYLTTVMGTAFQAGVMDTAETLAMLKENSVLNAMLSTLDNKEGVLTMIASLIEIATETAGKAAAWEAEDQVDKQVLAPIRSFIEKTGETVTRLEATSKTLLAGAEAKANLITRKRQEALDNFQTSLGLVKQKVAVIVNLDNRLEQMSHDLNQASADHEMDPEAMYKRIGQISSAQKALGNQKDLAMQQLIVHFGGQSSTGRSNSKDLIGLVIPEKVEEGKGMELISNFETYINGRAGQFYALLPYINRIMED